MKKGRKQEEREEGRNCDKKQFLIDCREAPSS